MRTDDGHPDLNERAVAERVHDALADMHHARREFIRAMQAGELDQRLRLAMQARVLDVFEELRPFRSRVDEETWKKSTQINGEELPDALASRTVTRTRQVGLGREQKTTETQPVLLTPADLLDISEELDDIAEQIGFTPAPPKNQSDVHGGMI